MADRYQSGRSDQADVVTAEGAQPGMSVLLSSTVCCQKGSWDFRTAAAARAVLVGIKGYRRWWDAVSLVVLLQLTRDGDGEALEGLLAWRRRPGRPVQMLGTDNHVCGPYTACT